LSYTNPLKTGDELRCPGRECPYPTNGTRRVTLIINSVKSSIPNQNHYVYNGLITVFMINDIDVSWNCYNSVLLFFFHFIIYFYGLGLGSEVWCYVASHWQTLLYIFMWLDNIENMSWRTTYKVYVACCRMASVMKFAKSKYNRYRPPKYVVSWHDILSVIRTDT